MCDVFTIQIDSVNSQTGKGFYEQSIEMLASKHSKQTEFLIEFVDSMLKCYSTVFTRKKIK